ncbi:MAG TPA: lysylphosphatidylglycerol synthase transmembrane domain-containing protein [Candidatus Saccharimonadales bacterium]|nr:lysylphosphatidylglycerol synthase transmembrane domain-containing protein [Candidatus Saccharimonadales bacterium]
MSENSAVMSFVKRRWKLLVNIVTVLALALLVVLIRHQLMDTISNFNRVNGWLLLLIIPVEFFNYHAQAKLYQGLFVMIGKPLSYKSMFKLSLELNFVNHVFPSGGVTGVSYFGIRLRSEGVSLAKSTLVQAIKMVLIFLSFEILLMFGMFVLAVNGRASNIVIFIGSSLATFLLFGTGAFLYVVSKKSRIDSFFTSLTLGLNKLIHFIRPHHPETINVAAAKLVFDEFHDSYIAIRSQLGKLKQPFWWAMLANITEVAVVLIVFMAFGEYVNVGAIILAYAIANFAGLISVLPGGVGIYEALMTAVLATTGVRPSISLPAIVMYRVLNTILQLPPGYYYYHRSLREGKVEAVEDNAA